MWEQHQTLVLRIGLCLTKNKFRSYVETSKSGVSDIQSASNQQTSGEFYNVLETSPFTAKLGDFTWNRFFFLCQEDLQITWKCLLQSPSYYGDAIATKFHLVPKPRTAAQKAEILIPNNPEQHFRSLRLGRRETIWKSSPGYRSAADAPNTHKDIQPQDSLNPFWCQTSFAREFLNRQKRVMIKDAYEMMDGLQGNKVRK